ncbi:histidine kinase 1 [Actinidia rufa]|uniref:histidine kinase n=1 Tax=Actinidia rufa TaxID=165716 RepID=A0A7J0DCT7_9ERIC|nr:histidine kinase 1 [Actinidia rufa]
MGIRHGGTDLGLCIVRTLVNKMGGEFKVAKKNGPGIDPSKWESGFESFELVDPLATRTQADLYNFCIKHGGTVTPGSFSLIKRNHMKRYCKKDNKELIQANGNQVNKIGGEIKVVKKNGPVTVFKNSLQELLIDLLTAVVLPLADYMQDYQMTSWDSEVKEGCTSTDLSPEQNPVRVPVQALDDASSIEVLSPQVVNLQKKEEMQESSSEKKLEKTEGISGRR